MKSPGSVDGANRDLSNPTNLIDLDEEKKKAEVAKLQLEVAKITNELATGPQLHRFEKLKAYGTIVTTLVAILGVYLTLRSQQLSNEAEGLRRSNEIFLAALKRFGDENEVGSRLTAVVSLERYLAGEQAETHSQIIQLFVSALEIEPNEAVKSQIRGALARHPSMDVIAALRSRNLALQDMILEANHSRHSSTVSFELIESAPERVHEIGKLIDGNAMALLSVLNAIKARDGIIKDLDLSGIAFTMPSVTKVSETTVNWESNTVLQFPENVAFQNVDLSYAKLSWLTFTGCRFTNVKLDNVRLINTTFSECQFEGSTSMRDFVFMYSRGALGPTFHSCQLFVTAFTPTPVNFTVDDDDQTVAYRIDDSTWKILKNPNDFETRFTYSPTSDMKGSFTEGSGAYWVLMPRRNSVQDKTSNVPH